MFITLYILPPLVGGFIGYVTNDIAIRMLFRPHTAKHIMGWRVPFTPGIIPKEKGRIAEAVGTAISDNLMSKEVLEKYLLSDNMVGRVRSSMEEFIAMQKVNEESVSQFLEHYLSHGEVLTLADNAKEGLTRQMHDKISDPELGRQVAKAAMTYVGEKITSNGGADILSEIGGLMGGFGMAAKRAVSSASSSTYCVSLLSGFLRRTSTRYCRRTVMPSSAISLRVRQINSCRGR